ncbi:taste receptor type 2 member 41-like [Aquarana catesbeiana]|uniref:taste receptor type 2 member 41-like n=1 Tax=Aquarana catesbeiana TaxID=8400 RepID=UPI003CCA2CA2
MMVLNIVLLSMNVLESLLSFFLNSCIVLIHIKSLRHGMKKMSPSDLIQLVMGVTNITMRGTMLVNTTELWHPIYYQKNIFHTMVILIPFHLYFNYWLIAWLSTHYWTNITNLKHQIFVWIKRSFSSFIPHFLLLSAIVSLSITLPSIWFLDAGVSGQNSTSSGISLTGFYFIPLACATICLSFSLILVSLIITTSSLLTHVQNMKKNGSELSGSRVQAHVSAVRTMILLLLLSAIISTADLLIFMPQPHFPAFIYPIAWLILAFFPSLEASIIIQSSPKLRKMFLQRFCAGTLVRNEDLQKE